MPFSSGAWLYSAENFLYQLTLKMPRHRDLPACARALMCKAHAGVDYSAFSTDFVLLSLLYIKTKLYIFQNRFTQLEKHISLSTLGETPEVPAELKKKGIC